MFDPLRAAHMKKLMARERDDIQSKIRERKVGNNMTSPPTTITNAPKKAADLYSNYAQQSKAVAKT